MTATFHYQVSFELHLSFLQRCTGLRPTCCTSGLQKKRAVYCSETPFQRHYQPSFNVQTALPCALKSQRQSRWVTISYVTYLHKSKNFNLIIQVPWTLILNARTAPVSRILHTEKLCLPLATDKRRETKPLDDVILPCGHSLIVTDSKLLGKGQRLFLSTLRKSTKFTFLQSRLTTGETKETKLTWKEYDLYETSIRLRIIVVPPVFNRKSTCCG